MSSIVDKCMEDEEQRYKTATTADPCDTVEVIIKETEKDSGNADNPFCYNSKSECPCGLTLQECLLQNSKHTKAGGKLCPEFHDYSTPRQEAARDKCIVELRDKIKLTQAVINAAEKNKTVAEKSIAYGCLGCGCFLGAAFIMFMAACGILIYKWSCDFLLWIADKF